MEWLLWHVFFKPYRISVSQINAHTFSSADMFSSAYILSSFMIFHLSFNKSTRTDATRGAGISQPYGAPYVIPIRQWSSRCLIKSFLYSVFSAMVLSVFTMAWSILPFTTSDYHFRIFKLFLSCVWIYIYTNITDHQDLLNYSVNGFTTQTS